MSILLPLVLFACVVPLVIRLWHDVRRNRRLHKRGARTMGELVGFTVPENSHRYRCGRPVATYVVDGRTYTVNDDGNVAHEGPFRGRRLTVCYDPADPTDAVIGLPFDAAEPILLVLLCVAEGALLLSAGVAIVRFFFST